MRATSVNKRAGGEPRARAEGRPARVRVGSSTIVHVREPHHLCGVQLATRELCRMIGLSESDVFQAVIAVSELAHRLFIEGGRKGKVELSIVRTRGGRAMEARAENAEDEESPVSATLTFPAGGVVVMS